LAVIVSVLESSNRELSTLARGAGLSVIPLDPHTGLVSIERGGAAPDVLMVDLRGQGSFPQDLSTFKRRHPRTGVIIVISSLDPAIMLDAMRAGVTEVVQEPVSGPDLRAAVDRVLGASAPATEQGQVLAFVGAKGGVGTTTLAVNVAAALAGEPGASVLVTDLHITGHGDAALFLGVEPRFSITDALESVHRLDRAVVNSLVARAKSGVDVLGSPDRPALRHPEPQQLRALIDQLSMQYQYVILDIPRSDLGTMDAVDPVSAMTLVVNQELPTVRRAGQVATLLRQRYGKDKVGSVVSRYDARAEIGQEDIERVVGLPVWAVLPSDYRRAVAAANVGRPLVREGQSRLGSAMQQFARKLAGRPAEAAAKAPAARTVGRLGGFF
jgi:pilus assembly protein CpaE